MLQSYMHKEILVARFRLTKLFFMTVKAFCKARRNHVFVFWGLTTLRYIRLSLEISDVVGAPINHYDAEIQKGGGLA